MSGGSFEYLCYKNFSEIVERTDLLQEMADELAKLGYANDAAKETQRLLNDIRKMENRIDVHLESLKEVWKAMEWWKSCDWGEDSLKEALMAYRGDESSE